MANIATAARPRYSEALHVLTDRTTREIIMGLAIETAEMAGDDVRPKEGEKVRDLIAWAIEGLEQNMSKAKFAKIKARGAQALAERDEASRALHEDRPTVPVEA